MLEGAIVGSPLQPLRRDCSDKQTAVLIDGGVRAEDSRHILGLHIPVGVENLNLHHLQGGSVFLVTRLRPVQELTDVSRYAGRARFGLRGEYLRDFDAKGAIAVSAETEVRTLASHDDFELALIVHAAQHAAFPSFCRRASHLVEVTLPVSRWRPFHDSGVGESTAVLSSHTSAA